MDYRNILTEVRDGVLHLTLNRPEKLNALSEPLLEEFFAALREAEDNPKVGALVVNGAGRAFCAGYDITPDPRAPTSYERGLRADISRMERRHRRWGVLWNLNKPVIAQVHGYCVAGGTDLALHCDVIIATEDTQIGFPPVRAQGAPPTHMWTYHVGPQWAKSLLLTGDLIDGKTAAQIGLVLKAVPTSALEAEAHNLARRMALIDPHLLAANKAICNKAIELMGRTMLQQLALETDAIAHKSAAAEEFGRIGKEKGLKAALEWRDGKFRG